MKEKKMDNIIKSPQHLSQNNIEYGGKFRILNYTVGLQQLLLGNDDINAICLLFKGVHAMELIDGIENPLIEVSDDISQYSNKISGISNALKLYKIKSKINNFEGCVLAYHLRVYKLNSPFVTRIADMPEGNPIKYL
ncbi:MAG: hypothetical protein MK212_04120 [Saprospiraceae bacterium]|nr:hypothetical protein [Saprospiraceae bacterium]